MAIQGSQDLTKIQLRSQESISKIREADFDAFDDIDNTNVLGDLPDTNSVVVNVKTFGAYGNGVSDDSVAIQHALDSDANIIYIPAGTYIVNTGLTISATKKITGDGVDKTILLNNTTISTFITIGADNVVLENLTLEEYGASPLTDGTNVGLYVKASKCLIQKIKIKGFDFPLLNRSTADLNYDNNTYNKCEISHGNSWGLEVDSSKNITITDCICHTNGLDGIKITNSSNRTCEGLKVIGGESYNNGQLDTEAGGPDTSNGNGIDIYSGGYRFVIMGLYCHDNYGSGFNAKGQASDASIYVQGEGSFIGCHSHNNKSTSGGTSHGFEFNVGNNNSCSLITMTNCHASGNTGKGIAFLGGFSQTVVGGSFTNNGTGGISIQSFDTIISSVSVLGNTGIGIQVGVTSDASYKSKRIKIRDCIISGLYDTNLADAISPRLSSGTKVTTQGIRIYSDSADVLVDGCEISNCSDAGLMNLGLRVKNVNTTIYGCAGGSIQVLGGNLTAEDIVIENVDFNTNSTLGAIYCTALLDADRIILSQTGSTASRTMRINNASASVNLGQLTSSGYTNTTVLISAGVLKNKLSNIYYGSGTPEASLAAGVGSIYTNTAGSAGTTLYIKESGTGNTGWAAK